MIPCNCQHVGHCPLTGPIGQITEADVAELLTRTDTDGNPLWTAIPGRDLGTAILFNKDGSLTDPSIDPTGGFVITDGKGSVYLLLVAADPARVVAYAKDRVGKRCRAESKGWCASHPNPKVAN